MGHSDDGHLGVGGAGGDLLHGRVFCSIVVAVWRAGTDSHRAGFHAYAQAYNCDFPHTDRRAGHLDTIADPYPPHPDDLADAHAYQNPVANDLFHAHSDGNGNPDAHASSVAFQAVRRRGSIYALPV